MHANVGSLTLRQSSISSCCPSVFLQSVSGEYAPPPRGATHHSRTGLPSSVVPHARRGGSGHASAKLYTCRRLGLSSSTPLATESDELASARLRAHSSVARSSRKLDELASRASKPLDILWGFEERSDRYPSPGLAEALERRFDVRPCALPDELARRYPRTHLAWLAKPARVR